MPNTAIYKEQGGSVQRIGSGGSLNVESGGRVALGNTTFHFGQDVPVFSASPGAVYFRSDGSAAGIYVNTSTGNSGSVWASASLNLP